MLASLAREHRLTVTRAVAVNVKPGCSFGSEDQIALYEELRVLPHFSRRPQDVCGSTAPSCQGVVPPPLDPPAQRLTVASPVRGAFLLPRHPHDRGDFALPWTPSNRGSFRAPPVPPSTSTWQPAQAIETRGRLVPPSRKSNATRCRTEKRSFARILRSEIDAHTGSTLTLSQEKRSQYRWYIPYATAVGFAAYVWA